MEDIKWVEVLTQLPKRIRIPVWLRWTVIIVLILLIILSIIGIIQYHYDHQSLDVTYTESRPHAFTDSFAYEPEDLVESSDVIYEGIVIDISFVAEQESYLPHYYLDTVYTVAVIRTCKGSTDLIETIYVSNGLQDFKLQEQLDALQKAGAPTTYKQINARNEGIKPQIGSSYLFCVKERDDLQERWADNYSQFALSDNLALPWYDKYNPDVIKEYLPYVPHPLLILAIIGSAVLAVIVVIRRKRKHR